MHSGGDNLIKKDATDAGSVVAPLAPEIEAESLAYEAIDPGDGFELSTPDAFSCSASHADHVIWSPDSISISDSEIPEAVGYDLSPTFARRYDALGDALDNLFRFIACGEESVRAREALAVAIEHFTTSAVVPELQEWFEHQLLRAEAIFEMDDDEVRSHLEQTGSVWDYAEDRIEPGPARRRDLFELGHMLTQIALPLEHNPEIVTPILDPKSIGMFEAWNANGHIEICVPEKKEDRVAALEGVLVDAVMRFKRFAFRTGLDEKILGAKIDVDSPAVHEGVVRLAKELHKKTWKTGLGHASISDQNYVAGKGVVRFFTDPFVLMKDGAVYCYRWATDELPDEPDALNNAEWSVAQDRSEETAQLIMYTALAVCALEAPVLALRANEAVSSTYSMMRALSRSGASRARVAFSTTAHLGRQTAIGAWHLSGLDLVGRAAYATVRGAAGGGMRVVRLGVDRIGAMSRSEFVTYLKTALADERGFIAIPDWITRVESRRASSAVLEKNLPPPKLADDVIETRAMGSARPINLSNPEQTGAFRLGELTVERRSQVEGWLGARELNGLSVQEQSDLIDHLIGAQRWTGEELQSLIGVKGMQQFLGYGTELPLGFESIAQYQEFQCVAMAELHAAGVPLYESGVAVYVQGSSVTGFKSGTDIPFRWVSHLGIEGRAAKASDIDIAVVVTPDRFDGFVARTIESIRSWQSANSGAEMQGLEWWQRQLPDGSIGVTKQYKKFDRVVNKQSRLDEFNCDQRMRDAFNHTRARMRESGWDRNVQFSVMTPESPFFPDAGERLLMSAEMVYPQCFAPSPAP